MQPPKKQKGMVHLVWLWDPDDERCSWETDWIREALSSVPGVVEVVDAERRTFRSDAVVVVRDPMEPSVRRYLEGYSSRGLRYGLVQLSDEGTRWLAHPAEAAFVLRNYYTRKAGLFRQPKVHFFALGYKQRWWPADDPTIRERAHAPADRRRYLWSFAGAMKADRSKMLACLERIGRPDERFVHIVSGWNGPDSLTTQRYRDLLLDSVFVASPQGNVAIDCFRTYEALECGCIPLVPVRNGVTRFPYYREAFRAYGMIEDPPFLEFETWNDLEKVLTPLVADRDALEALRKRCLDYWLRYKALLQQKVASLVAQEFVDDKQMRPEMQPTPSTPCVLK